MEPIRSKGLKLGELILQYLKKLNNKLTQIGSSAFRVKALPPPTFKIGSGRHSVDRVEIANQEFVRAELENFDFDYRFMIESFTVCIIPNDTCKYTVIKNIGVKINEEIRSEFQKLKENDVVIFKNIFVKGPDEKEIELMPVMITIYK